MSRLVVVNGNRKQPTSAHEAFSRGERVRERGVAAGSRWVPFNVGHGGAARVSVLKRATCLEAQMTTRVRYVQIRHRSFARLGPLTS